MANETDKAGMAGEPPASPLGGRLARWPLHPYLLCYFAVASFLAPNVEVIPPFRALPLLATVLLGCLAVHLALHFALRGRTAAASLAIFALAFVFFFEPQIRRVLLLLPGAYWRLPLGPLGLSVGKFLTVGICAFLPVLALLLGWRLHRTPRRVVNLCLNLLLLGLFLSSTSAVLLGWHRALAAAPPPDFTPQNARGIEPDQYPDIVHVVLDAYARDDVYQKLTGENDAPMTELLGQWDFQVAKHTISNFPMTHGSMFSLMNFDYPRDTVVLYGKALRNSAAVRQLRHLGYHIEVDSMVGIGNPRDNTIFLVVFVDLFWHRTLWGSVREVLYRHGWLDIRRKGTFFRRQFERAMHRLAALPEGRDRPTYFQAHVLGPHPPFVFDAQGRPIYVTDLVSDQEIHQDQQRNRALGMASFDEYGMYYADQARHSRRMLEEALTGFFAGRRSRPSIVIVQSDHGPGVLLLPFHPEQGKMPFSFANYLAIHVCPPLTFTLPAATTPVNIFPLLFNQIFGMSLPMREDRHFLTGWGRETREYTEEIRQALWPASLRRHRKSEGED